jgi:peroxiredoxin
VTPSLFALLRIRPAAALAAAVAVSGGTFGGCVRAAAPPRWSECDREPALPMNAAAGASDRDPLFNPFLGNPSPDRFVGGSWVNSERCLSLAALRGNVVVLAFAMVDCPACRTFVPRLVDWENRFAPQGATVIYVDNGRRDSLGALQKAACDEGLPFALFHDRLGHMVWAYGVRAFPTVYVVGRDGKVVWEGVVTGREDEAQQAFEGALREAE